MNAGTDSVYLNESCDWQTRVDLPTQKAIEENRRSNANPNHGERLHPDRDRWHHVMSWSNGKIERIYCGGKYLVDGTDCFFCQAAKYNRPLAEAYKVHKNENYDVGQWPFRYRHVTPTGYLRSTVNEHWRDNRDADGNLVLLTGDITPRSCDEIKLKTADIDSAINELRIQIQENQQTRQNLIRDLEIAKAHEFLDKHCHTAVTVRREYLELLEQNSFQGDTGFAVDVCGYNPKGIHDWMLKPESRDKCLPSKVVEEAFDVINKKLYIAEETWGRRFGS